MERREPARYRQRDGRGALSQDGAEHELRCDFIAGCDGFHGVCRHVDPARARSQIFERTIHSPGWASWRRRRRRTDELIYAYHERGFALHSMRSPEVSRLYVQCRRRRGSRSSGPTTRIWGELHARLETGDGWTLAEGPILEKSITPMRSFVVEPMRYGRLFLAGDAAHIVPPTGAKGMNLAIADVRVLARRWPTGTARAATDAARRLLGNLPRGGSGACSTSRGG